MRRRAFTLVELLVVIAIIGILLSLILIAAMQAGREAKIVATQSLITKLDTALQDRIQAVMAQRVDTQTTHMLMAWPYFTSVGVPSPTVTTSAYLMPQILPRAQVIASYDHFRAEFPDVFFVQATSGQFYPINFGLPACFDQGGNGYPYNYAQPLGTGAPSSPIVEGMFGASFGIASGLYKNMGNVLPTSSLPAPQTIYTQGADGTDNNGDGLIDNLPEWYIDPKTNTANANIQASLAISFASHTHVTARSEMLYAIIVESTGPYGSTMTRDDFAANQVGDTDGDGLPEFLDAWGNPLQFFRWPVLYHSDSQKGMYAPPIPTSCPGSPLVGPFNGIFEPREQAQLDPNQTLMAPSWWSSSINYGTGGTPAGSPLSGSAGSGTMAPSGALGFQNFFHLLVEPLTASQGASPCTYWDRGTTFYQRRSFFTRPLILSAGPDGVYGVPIMTDASLNSLIGTNIDAASMALQLEGQAAQVNLGTRLAGSDAIYNGPYNNPINTDSGNAYIEDGADDITNQNAGSLETQTP